MIAASVLALSAGAASAQEKRPADYDQVKDKLWALEQSIYAGRAAGTLSVHENNRSPYYKPWPVGWSKPKPGPALVGDKEKLELTFVNMAYNGHTAVMMYKSHRTQLSDGTPADDYFEVTHIWSKDAAGEWKLLGARPQAVQPPGK